jgi:hypothetical protein
MADNGIAFRNAPARIFAIAGLSVALVLVAACSSANGGSSGGGGPSGGGGSSGGGGLSGGGVSQGGTASAGAPLTASKALMATASNSQKVNSAVETLIVRETGVQSGSTAGVIQFQRRPTTLIGESLKLTSNGKSSYIKAILSETTFYLSEPALTKQLGKPWIKLDLSAMKKTPLGSISQLVHSLQSNNFLNLTQLFAVTKNVRVVGKQTVDGVATTEYAGSFRTADALKALSPAYRKVLAPEFQALGNTPVSFRVWIDGHHYTRKVTDVETINGETISTTVFVKAINQPVHITIPPSSQTVTPPGM